MKQISIEIIHKCPNNCMHCSSCSGPDCTLMIKTENVKKLIDSAVELNTKILSISGGEPLLHPGLLSIEKCIYTPVEFLLIMKARQKV